MSQASLYLVAAVAIFLLGVHALTVSLDLVRKVIAANVMASGVFLFLIASAARLPSDLIDPVPQSMVLTGIVVSVSATALGLALARRIVENTGQARLPEDRQREGS